MIELVQCPWSPFCIVQRRILEFARARFKIVNIPNTDRTLVWKLTRKRYYQVPILRDGREVLFETGPDTQVIAKYIDLKFNLGLFPHELEGIQSILWRHIENEVEGRTFKLNDIYFEEFVPAREHLNFIRHKERKFGHNCISAWRDGRDQLLGELRDLLRPFEEMVTYRPFLIDQSPRFVDFDLFGMLSNLLYSGHYELPGEQVQLRRWFERMAAIKHQSLQ